MEEKKKSGSDLVWNLKNNGATTDQKQQVYSKE